MDRAGRVALAGPPGPPGHGAEKMRPPRRRRLGNYPRGLASAAIVQAALAFLDAQPRSNGEPAG